MLQLPQTFLRDRSWDDSIFSRRADQGRRSPGRLVGLNDRFDMVCHLRDGRRLEKSRGRKLNFCRFVDMAENPRGEERVSARRKEVIMDTDLLEVKNLCPTLGQ